MQPSNSTGASQNADTPENPRSPNPNSSVANSSSSSSSSTITTLTTARNDCKSSRKSSDNSEGESVIDVSGRSLEFDLLEKTSDDLESLYFYKNAFSLVPTSVTRLRRLRTLKFFGNDVNLFPDEFGNLVGLECLQVKVSALGLNGLSFTRFKGLKELELSKAPPRPSLLTLLSEIAGLKSLTKLSVCYFSIRYLPPEIGCLHNLEYLDLSFNKLKRLPTEITYLKTLVSLKVANNKLLEVPPGLSLLQRLKNLDLSNNRLTSLGCLELDLMRNLQYLYLQFNKLLSCCQIPSWINCNLEGNGMDLSNDDFISSSVEMDVYETSIQGDDGKLSSKSFNYPTSGQLTGSSSNTRCSIARRSNKRWKRQNYLQQKARQERLNNSRKWKGEGHIDMVPKERENCKLHNLNVLTSRTCEDGRTDIIGVDDGDQKFVVSGQLKTENLPISFEDDNISSKKGLCEEGCSSSIGSVSELREDGCCADGKSLSLKVDEASELDEVSSSKQSKTTFKAKRHSDRDLDNPKPCKCQKANENSTLLSRKYSELSFCGVEDRLPDGFYDAGRDRPFLELGSYEDIMHLDSREVILLDREKDEELDAVVLSAQALVAHLKRLSGLVKERNMLVLDNLQLASLLAIFVSDHFGGSDRSTAVEKARKTVSGSNYRKPFVCTCSAGNNDNMEISSKVCLPTVQDIILSDLCERSLHSIKSRQRSIVVPLGMLQFGVCRHRALLMKYLCDRMEPPIPCELVRGYLDYVPHAWNIIHVKRGESLLRMVVDTCHPLDIKEETDPEYFCRYIPLSRIIIPIPTEKITGPGFSFPTFTNSDEIDKTVSSKLIRCKFGSVEAAAKVRVIEVCQSSEDEIRNFEFSCLGEVRLLGSIQHSCIVEMYGHQLCTQWLPRPEGNQERRILRSVILLEYVKGGSLKNYIEKISKTGEKHVPMDLALCIAQDVASALTEIHAKHIIHRDIKSENILIDLDNKRSDGMPVVKLCDFDRAVPLKSFLHNCCVAHRGIPPPDVCVGTPCWMAPEVLRAMHEHSIYGLEVDIWSYGCLLFELLTLQVPYSGLCEVHIHELIQMGKRPPLTEKLEALGSMNEPDLSDSVCDLESPEFETETLVFLVYLFRRCTEENPADRPTAAEIYELLHARTNSIVRE